MAAFVDTRMPGVYTVEVPTLPPSIALVPSAVPCFIGYTQEHTKNGEDVKNKAVRVKNMREYQDWFEGAHKPDIKVDVAIKTDNSGNTTSVVVNANQPTSFYRMYYAMQLYYANGGGACFIVSVGKYKDDGTIDVNELNADEVYNALKKAKDITILSFPDAAKTIDEDKYNTLTTSALKHCLKLKNRVLLLDVNDTLADIDAGFRQKTSSIIDEKKYGAAYYPFLKTTLQFQYEMGGVTVKSSTRNNQAMSAADIAATAAAVADYKSKKEALANAESSNALYGSIKNAIEKAHAANNAIVIADLLEIAKKEAKRITGSDSLDATLAAPPLTDFATLKTAIDALITGLDVAGKTTVKNVALSTAAEIAKKGDLQGMTLGILEDVNNELASKIKQAIRDLPVIMPPSPAIAGIMVQTDATQGVWKAPANVSVAAVIAPTVEIDDDLHASLNSDATSGKSINAIRVFEGRGVLVFGARTLAGNDLEWRYVSVRRTFCFIEDAIGRAMQSFVFEPNTRDTWIKVKAMISNFLVEIWKAGGLFGNTTNEAFQVNVGLPETMSDVDILEGKMIVEIKLRVSRPAEFIILKYEHKFQANAN